MTESAPIGADSVPAPVDLPTARVPTPPVAPHPAPSVPADQTPAVPADQPPSAPGDAVPASAGDPSGTGVDPEGVAPPLGLWERMRSDPQYAPEHLALEAVRRIGPEARDWAARVRAGNPQISSDELAQLAIRTFVTRARLSGAVSGVAGLPGAVVDLGVLAWTQARLVLYVAAAYGHDPEHPDRATDLLVLQRVHKIAQTARLALGVASGRARASALLGQSAAPLRQAMLRLGFKLARMAGIRAAKRLVAKAVPGAAIVLGTWANSSATRDLATRSVALYRPRAGTSSHSPTR